MRCRHCAAWLELGLIDLGCAPPSNAYLDEQALRAPERWFPLRVLVCERCWLVQTEDFARVEDLFVANYAYFSSYSASWLVHAERYVHDMRRRFGLHHGSQVIEIAANDGYLLQYVRALGIPCTGIEPTASTADAARAKGIPIIEDFFGVKLATELQSRGLQADLLIANNVLAHVPDINDFVSGFRILLKPAGVATFEFPHLLRLIEGVQFDTIYHEHFSYFSLVAAERILAAHGLTVFDVQELPTHGGSLRLFAQCEDTGMHAVRPAVAELLACEESAGVRTSGFYAGFQDKAEQVKNDFLRFLLTAANERAKVVAYGAAAKGNTLLNFAGVRRDLIAFVADRNVAKQGHFLPGSRIPIFGENRLREARPDYVVILPWNLSAEIIDQLGYVAEWGGRFAMAVPRMQVSQC